MNSDKKYAALTVALLAGIEAAAQQDETEDGGTCNFDSPYIDYRAMGMSRKNAIAAIEAAGLLCFAWQSWGGIRLVITGFQRGQGNRRSRMAEAFAEEIKSRGIVGGMYYQMD